jgi:hypothetical protein
MKLSENSEQLLSIKKGIFDFLSNKKNSNNIPKSLQQKATKLRKDATKAAWQGAGTAALGGVAGTALSALGLKSKGVPSAAAVSQVAKQAPSVPQAQSQAPSTNNMQQTTSSKNTQNTVQKAAATSVASKVATSPTVKQAVLTPNNTKIQSGANQSQVADSNQADKKQSEPSKNNKTNTNATQAPTQASATNSNTNANSNNSSKVNVAPNDVKSTLATGKVEPVQSTTSSSQPISKSTNQQVANNTSVQPTVQANTEVKNTTSVQSEPVAQSATSTTHVTNAQTTSQAPVQQVAQNNQTSFTKDITHEQPFSSTDPEMIDSYLDKSVLDKESQQYVNSTMENAPEGSSYVGLLDNAPTVKGNDGKYYSYRDATGVWGPAHAPFGF